MDAKYKDAMENEVSESVHIAKEGHQYLWGYTKVRRSWILFFILFKFVFMLVYPLNVSYCSLPSYVYRPSLVKLDLWYT